MTRASTLAHPLLACVLVVGACHDEAAGPDATARSGTASTSCSADVESATLVDDTAWTTAFALLPAPAAFVRPVPSVTWLGELPVFAAASARLTWLVEFAAPDAAYHVWVRSHGGYTTIGARLDDVPVTTATTGVTNGWWRIGHVVPGAGRRHLDIDVPVDVGIDAILLTRDASLVPDADVAAAMPGLAAHLPSGRAPTDAPRAYRFASRSEPMIVGFPQRHDEDPTDWSPDDPATPPSRRLWAAAGQRVRVAIAAHAGPELEDDDTILAWVGDLVGPVTIPASRTDVRFAMRRPYAATVLGTDTSLERPLADVLVKHDQGCVDDRTLPPDSQGIDGPFAWSILSPGDERLFFLTLDVPPDTPPGTYAGEFTVGPKRDLATSTRVALELEVLPLALDAEVSGENGIYYPFCPASTYPACGVGEASASAYKPDDIVRSDLRRMADAGIDALVAYGGAAMLPMLAEAGLDDAVTLASAPPDAAAMADIDAEQALAASLGIGQVSYYVKDEPTVADLPTLLERLDAIRAAGTTSESPFAPFSVTVAINSGSVWTALVDHVDHAIMELNVFWEACGPMQLRAAPHAPAARPIAYWAANRSLPRTARLLGGLWPRAVGYVGISPWSFQDPAPHTGLNDFTVRDAGGLAIPTRDWMALADGLDDVRFLDALDAALAEAETYAAKCGDPLLLAAIADARLVREQAFRCMPWPSLHGYACPAIAAVGTACLAQIPRSTLLLTTDDDDLDHRRRAMADAAIMLADAIGDACPS